jgi:TolB-like protein/DNA-binding SARP family transcriptional activator
MPDTTKSASLFLLGNMRLVDPGGEGILLRNRKTRAILAVLGLSEGKPVSRSRLSALFWDESDDAQARMSLRHALSELNRFVNARISNLIEINRTSVRLNTEICWIDVFDPATNFERLLDDLDGLSSAFDDWLADERAKFEDRERASLERDLQRLDREDAAPELQAAAARRLISLDQTHEGAVRSLMTSFVKLGDRTQAIREYERFRQALKTKFDLSPSQKTVAHYEALRPSPDDHPAATPREQLMDANQPKPKRALPDRIAWDGSTHQPSIAVLPLRNLSRDSGDPNIGDGLVEDLREALSRVPNFLVISRLSSLAFRDQDRSPRDIGDALGVQYVISGAIRVIEERLRLTMELTDTRSGAALWTARFDEKFSDLLEVQERLAYSIARSVGRYLHAAELKRIRTKRLADLGAYELFLRAQESMHNSSRAVFDASERLFDEVIARDPGYAPALAWRAYWHVIRIGQGWSPDPTRDTAEAERFARQAMESDDAEPMAFAVYGYVMAYLHKDFEVAFQCFETALGLNPNTAQAWSWRALVRAWMGDGPRAIEEINKAIALSPYDPLMYLYSSNAAMAFLADGQYGRAIEFALRSLQENQNFTSAYRTLVIAYQLAGKTEQARRAVHQLLKLEPGLTVEKFRKRYPGSASPQADLYCDALARAGVPAC